jgi:2-hydroxychromene-2-carboxylate isomerase
MVHDLEFFFDPVCPFAWITSRWVTEVQARTDYSVRWRFISLAIVNEDRDYAQFPPGYAEVHGTGKRWLRVAAAVDEAVGNEAVAALYTALGTRLHTAGVSRAVLGGARVPGDLLAGALADAGLDPAFVAAADDEARDAVLRADTATALGRTGPDVGTPILTFDPGTDRENSLFGPVISRIPRGADAVALWDAVRTLAATPGFAEFKRSLRDEIDFS